MKNQLTYVCKVLIVSIFFTLFTGSCTPKHEDPLKNTKQLVKRGHASLYYNGAMKIPGSSVHLIPPGPSPIEIAEDLVGLRARFAFLKAVHDAADAVYIVSYGTKLSFRKAAKIHRSMAILANEIEKNVTKEGINIIYKKAVEGAEIIGDSWQFSKELIDEMEEIGDSIIRSSKITGDRIRKSLKKSGERIIKKSGKFSKKLFHEGVRTNKKIMSEAYGSFIMGYATLGSNLSSNMRSTVNTIKQANPVEILKYHNQWRKAVSDGSVEIIKIGTKNYLGNIKESIGKAGTDIKDYKRTGVSLASLKAMRWILKAIFWDAIIKPVTHIATGGLGYLAVNGIFYPVIVLGHQGKALVEIAASVTWNSAKSVYEIVAPSATLALASIYSALSLSGTTITSGVIKGGGYMVGKGTIRRGEITSVVIKSGGYVAGKTVQYIGVPLVAGGVAIGGTLLGSIYTIVGSVPASAIVVGGKSLSLASRAFGTVLGGTVMAAGPVAALSVGLTKGVYHVAKAIAVPTSYTLGAGIVLGYGTISHIAAHTLLGVSDAAYLVLSLEGPRWVVYAVTGKLGKGKSLVPGTVLNLKKMQKAGEKFKYVKVAPKTMKKIVKSTYKNLPRKKSPEDILTKKDK